MTNADNTRKLIVEEWLSLDGHTADATGGLDFFAKEVRGSYATARRTELLHSIDTILFGRRTWELFSPLWPERPVENDLLAEKMNQLNKIVFSSTLTSAPWGKWKEAQVQAGDPREKVRHLKTQPGGHLIVWGSVHLAQSLMKAQLVDEYHLHICPVLTGGGKRLFTEGSTTASLELLRSDLAWNGTISLIYTPQHS